MKTKYRIVSDFYLGYEAQYKLWWWPFWIEMRGINTFSSIEKAKEFISKHNKVYWTSTDK